MFIPVSVTNALSQAFQLIDKKPFRRLLSYLRPALGDKDIPHRTKLRGEILIRAKAVEKKIADVFKVSPYDRDLSILISRFRTYRERFRSHLTPGLPTRVTLTFP